MRRKSSNQLQLEIDTYMGRSQTSMSFAPEASIIADVLAHAPTPSGPKSTVQLDREIAEAMTPANLSFSGDGKSVFEHGPNGECVRTRKIGEPAGGQAYADGVKKNAEWHTRNNTPGAERTEWLNRNQAKKSPRTPTAAKAPKAKTPKTSAPSASQASAGPKSTVQLDREIAASKVAAGTSGERLTSHGEVTQATKRLATDAQAIGDRDAIDHLELLIASELGVDLPRHWLPGSTRWLARAVQKGGKKPKTEIQKLRDGEQVDGMLWLAEREEEDRIAGKKPLAERVTAYADRVEAKRERLEKASTKASAESRSRLGAAKRIGDGIPFGQPILVGHHSEKRHRRDIAKIDTNMRKGFEASDRAKSLAGRAAAIGTGGVSSDDPEAVQKLRAELAPLMKTQSAMKAANVVIKKLGKTPVALLTALKALGFSDKSAASLLEKDSMGRGGFAPYQLTNNGANIRRIEGRIKELLAKESAPARATITGVFNGLTFSLEENRDLNRVQIRYSGKPADDIRAKLKSAGFKWAPTEGAWQRQASNGAWYNALRVLDLPTS